MLLSELCSVDMWNENTEHQMLSRDYIASFDIFVAFLDMNDSNELNMFILRFWLKSSKCSLFSLSIDRKVNVVRINISYRLLNFLSRLIWDPAKSELCIILTNSEAYFSAFLSE